MDNDKHIPWRDVIRISRDDDHVYDLSSEEFQQTVEQIEDFLNFVECTDQGQQLLRDIQNNQAANNNGQRAVLTFNEDKPSGATAEGTITINPKAPDYIAFINQQNGEAIPISLERTVFHELSHLSDPRIAHVPSDDILAEEFATQRTDAFACEYMPSMGLRVAYMNGAGQIPTRDHEAIDGMGMAENDAYTREQMKNAIKELPERIKYELSQLSENEPAPDFPEPCPLKP